MMKRRRFLQLVSGGIGFAALIPFLGLTKAFATEMVVKMSLSNEEWKKRLSAQQYDILREAGTERPFTSALLDEHRAGEFVCAGCNLPLFLSSAKFESGTGWPSFFQAIPGHIETSTDYKIGLPRTEYHCARCGGHHGHVFEDGPKPTGLRYCNNGAVLKFIPKEG